MVKDYGVCSCGGRIHPQWFFGKKYLECAKCGNPVKNAETNPYARIGCAGECPRCEGLVSMKPHGQYCEHCKARGRITYLIDMGGGRLKYDAESFEAEGELERKYFARFGEQRAGKEWGEYTFTWFNDMGDWKPLDEDTTGWDEDDFADFRENKEYDLVNEMLENPKSSLYGAIENNMTYGDEEHFSTSYKVMDEDGDVGRLNLLISWEEPSNVQQSTKYYDKEPLYRLEFLAESFEAEEPYDEPSYCQNCDWYGMSSELVWGINPITLKNGKTFSKPQCPKCSYSSYIWSNEEPAWLQAESKKLPPVEKAIDSGIASGATMEGLDLALGAEEIPCEICGEGLFREHEDSMGDVCLSCYWDERDKQDEAGSDYEGWLLNFAESFSAEDFDAETERWIRIPHSRDDDFWGGSPPPYYGKGYGKKRIFPNEQEARRDYEKLLREEPESGWREDNIGVECGCGNFVLRGAGVWNHGSDTPSWGYSTYPNQVFSQNVHYDRDKEEPTSEEWEFATRWKEGEKNIVEVEYATKDHLEFERITYMPMKMLALGAEHTCSSCASPISEDDIIGDGTNRGLCCVPDYYDDDPLESWMEDFDAEDEREHPSVYWFVKGEIMERQREQGKMTENDLAEIVEIVATKAPLWMIDKGMREAEKLGDRGPWEILKMSAINRIILEEMDDDAVFSEKLGGFQAEMEIKTELCLHCGEKATETCDLCDEKECKECFEEHLVECNHCEGTGEIPRSWVSDSGDRWNPPSLDVTDYEPCEYCDEGQVCADEYVPQFSWDAERNESDICDICDEAEVMSEDDGYLCGKCGALSCHACGSGDPDEHPYCMPCIYQREKDAGEWSDDSWYDAETNGDLQLDESKKRTKMSAIRTGLAITTFGIVMWNLWTNTKQEKDISDIMDLV